jgi:hypothetical protein
MVASVEARPRPWVGPGAALAIEGAASVRIVDPDEPLFASPRSGAQRRGAARRHAQLPLYAATLGAGCSSRWLMVGPVAWVCEDRVALSRQTALAPTAPKPAGNGLPYRYFFVGPNGTFGYSDLAVAEQGVPDGQLEPGFAVAISEIRDRQPGDAFGRTSHGLWLPLRDLRPAQEVAFSGASLSDPTLDVAWVYQDRAALYDRPEGLRLAGQSRTRFERLRVIEVVTRRGRRWLRVGEGQWVSDADVRSPVVAAPPAGLRPRERWIDVDLSQQTLVAYEGDRPVYATLVSSGKGAAGSPEATPLGEHRIWVKLLVSDMDNLESEDQGRYYAIQSVPWVMYFEAGYGLHGTFWHRSFGKVRSHGCVNLAPLDAEWLFRWTSPRLPAGWSAVLPAGHEPGSLVRIR